MCVKKFANIDKETQVDIFDRVGTLFAPCLNFVPSWRKISNKQYSWVNENMYDRAGLPAKVAFSMCVLSTQAGYWRVGLMWWRNFTNLDRTLTFARRDEEENRWYSQNIELLFWPRRNKTKLFKKEYFVLRKKGNGSE